MLKFKNKKKRKTEKKREKGKSGAWAVSLSIGPAMHLQPQAHYTNPSTQPAQFPSPEPYSLESPLRGTVTTVL
jgi:hypothetical protein